MKGLLNKPCVCESIKTCPEIEYFSRGKLNIGKNTTKTRSLVTFLIKSRWT